MNTHTAEPIQQPLQSLRYPNSVMRCVEAVLGSSRRDALGIIRTAAESEIHFIRGPINQIKISTSNGEVVFQGVKVVEVVDITSRSGSQSLVGSCELAQRLARFAIRALEVVQERLKDRCVTAAVNACAGRDSDKILECDYRESRNSKEHSSSYHFFDTAGGSLTFQEGCLLLGSVRSLRKEYDPGVEMTIPSPLDCARLQAVYLPPPPIEEDYATAHFSNDKVVAMLKLLGAPGKKVQTELSTKEVRSMLCWARDNVERYRS